MPIKSIFFLILTVLFSTISHTKPGVSVRVTPHDSIGSAEKRYCNERRAAIQKCLKNLECLEYQQEPPTIAVCFSGGGFRAMFLSLGFLQGLEEAGLLESIMYVASLSGSTWAIGSWIANNFTLKQLQHFFSHSFNYGLKGLSDPKELLKVAQTILSHASAGQALSSIDIYGALLAKNLLISTDPDKLSLSFSNAHKNLNPAYHPFPLYTAILANIYPYEWIEAGPYELGSSFLKSYIPMDAYGSFFKCGVAAHLAPPLSFGYFMGIFGSAYGVSLQDMVNFNTHQISSIKNLLPAQLYGVLSKLIKQFLGSAYHQARFMPSQMPNFTYQLSCSPLHNQPFLTLVDAGIDFNLPLPPLLRASRAIDLIIIFDSSSSIVGHSTLIAAQKYATRKELPFPILGELAMVPTFTILDTFPSSQPAPIIAYFPRSKDVEYDPNFDPDICIQKEWCGSFNFSYTHEQIEKLCGLARATAKKYAPALKEIIKKIVLFKNRPQEVIFTAS